MTSRNRLVYLKKKNEEKYRRNEKSGVSPLPLFQGCISFLIPTRAVWWVCERIESKNIRIGIKIHDHWPAGKMLD